MSGRKLLQAAAAAAVDVSVPAASPHEPSPSPPSRSSAADGTITFSSFVFTIVTFFLLYALYLNYCCRPRPRDGAAAAAASDIAVDVAAREPAERMRRWLEAMPVVAYAAAAATEAEKERCSICLGEYEDGEELRVLVQCEHKFHKKCIDTWLMLYGVRCPLCRRAVMTPIAGGGGGREY